MSDLDRDLAERLSQLAAAVPTVSGQLDPVNRSAVIARHSVRMAWLTPLVVGVAAILGASVLSGPGAQPTPGATQSPRTSGTQGSSPDKGPPVSTDRSSDFDLVLRAGKPLYAPDEPIDISASLTYRGALGSVEISTDSGGPIMFGIREQVYGEIHLGGLSLLTCKRSTLTGDQSLVEPFKKSGGFSGDHPQADQFRVFFEDPQLRLPEGTWHIYAWSSSPCMGSEVAFQLNTQIEIVVDDDPAATPGHPPATEYPFKPVYGGADIGLVVLQLKSERPTYEARAPIELAVDYWFADGPRLIASHFQPEVGLSIVQLDATDPEGRITVYDSACVDLGLVTGKERHVEVGPRLIAEVRGDALPETNDELFVDGQLRLPVGTWRISASVAGTFAPCSGDGESYELQASLEIEVVERLE